MHSEIPLQNLTLPAETAIGAESESPHSEMTRYPDDEEAFRGTILPGPASGGKARFQWLAKQGRSFLIEWSSPRCLAIIVGLIISLVNPLKALFIPVPSAHIPNAPDDQPPFVLTLDTTTFIGNASVPLGLICLGSALARTRMPRGNYHDLPLGAISSLAIGRLIMMPIFGVLVCQKLAHHEVIDPNDKVLRFVCMLISATPTASTQVYMTQVYSGTGSAEHLSPFLLPQYFLMIFSTTALIAYLMQTLF